MASSPCHRTLSPINNGFTVIAVVIGGRLPAISEEKPDFLGGGVSFLGEFFFFFWGGGFILVLFLFILGGFLKLYFYISI